jgi:diacylglycerol kinase
MKRILRNKDSGTILERYLKSFVHALAGLWYAIKYEHNMVIIFTAAIVVVIAGFYFDISTYEWLFCIMAIGMVSATEMINTSLEAVVDLETNKFHPLVCTYIKIKTGYNYNNSCSKYYNHIMFILYCIPKAC